ncbi:MAG: hypothetical protein AAF483_02675 [Planctomycetota bacterium]
MEKSMPTVGVQITVFRRGLLLCVKPIQPPRVTWLPLLALFLLVASAGCDRTKPAATNTSIAPSEATTKFVSQNSAPRATLRECAAAYARLSSYRDEAFVRLEYKLEGQSHHDHAPLSVAWDDSGKIGLQVYSVQAGPSNDRWRLRINREEIAPAKQVLSRALTKQVDFDWLLADPIVAQSLSAGLAGFPPQLDLLLSPNPLDGLVRDDSSVVLKPSAMIGDRGCHVIAVETSGLEYELYIEKASMMLRRLVLPNQNLPPEILADNRITNLRLTIELEGIQTNKIVDWSGFQVPVESSDFLVTHFVPAPSVSLNPAVATQVPAFQLLDHQGQAVFQNSGHARNAATILVWLADHESSRLLAQQLLQQVEVINKKQSDEARLRVQFVWAEPTVPRGQTFDSLPSAWKLPGGLAVDRHAIGRDLFRIEEAPTVVLMDEQNRVQLIETGYQPDLLAELPELLEQIDQGVDVASRRQSAVRNVLRRFDANLQRAFAIDQNRQVTSEVKPSYSPELVGLEIVKTIGFDSKALATGSDTQERIWTLYENGSLWIRNANTPESSLELNPEWEWQPQGKLLIDASGRYVALVSTQTKLLQLYDCEKKRNQSIGLQINAMPHEFAWLNLKTNETPRLAAITAEKELILIDPENHEQLSGTCPNLPVALLPQSTENSVVQGRIVLANGSLEWLQLDYESTVNRLPGLGKQVSFGSKETTSVPKKMLGFKPRSGSWIAWQDDSRSRVLARGWLARDEPAMLMLDEQFNPAWHFRMPIRKRAREDYIASVSKDPSTGLAVWLMADADQTIYLLREDGFVEHFRFRDSVAGLSLSRSASALRLNVAFVDRLETHQLRWR